MTAIQSLLIAALAAFGGPTTDRAVLEDGRVLAGRIETLSSEALLLVTAEDGRRLPIDWDDVARLESRDSRTIHLANGDRITGRIVGVEAGMLVVSAELLPEIRIPLASLGSSEVVAAQLAAAGEAAIDAAIEEAQDDEDLFATEGDVLKPKDWTGKVALLGSFREGNSETLDVNFRAEAKRQWTVDRLDLSAGYSYGEAEGEKNTSNAFAGAKFDHFYNKRFYSYANATVLWDEIAEIDLRALVGIGAGLTVWKEPENGEKQYFDVEAGISAIYEKFSANGDDGLDPALRVATDYKNLLGETVEFSNENEFIMPFSEVDGWILRSITSLNVPLSDAWYLKNSLELDYQAAPPAGTENLDIRVLLGIEYSF